MGSSGSVGEAVISRNTAQTKETCKCGLRTPQREGQPSGKCELCARCERRCLCTCVFVYLCTCVLVYLCTLCTACCARLSLQSIMLQPMHSSHTSFTQWTGLVYIIVAGCQQFNTIDLLV